MMKILFFLVALLFLYGCGGGDTSNTQTNSYSYVPQELNTTVAVRFLNKATFGATLQDVKNLQKQGVEKWMASQFAIPEKPNIYLTKMIRLAKQCEPDVNSASITQYLQDNDTVFNKNKASFHSPRYRMTSWFDSALSEEDQLRHKVAYALSQIIVESDFEPIFTRRAEALARYFDILYANAFGSYKHLLQDISLNSGMGMFLTFNGSKKLYLNDANVSVYPDENYAREIMQPFSLGLYKLNIDATPQKDTTNNLIPTYTQEDVNELARVFTGWDLQRNRRYGQVGFRRGDVTHPLEMSAKYHDFGTKTFLGETIEADMNPKEEIFRAIDIIMQQKSVAPYISKNLIMRLTKSNPSKEYIARVATVFSTTQGNLKEVVKAIFLDKELWDDITTNTPIKYKEPLIAYTQFLRTMHAQPLPQWYFCGYGGPSDNNASNCQKVTNSFLFNDTRSYLAQGAGLAPNVFNFYDNDYIPNEPALKAANFHAPELQIQSDAMLINFSNTIYNILTHWERGAILEAWYKKDDGTSFQYKSVQEMIDDAPRAHNIPIYYIGSDKMLLDAQEEYNVMEHIIDGDTDGDFANLQDWREKDYHDDEKALQALIAFENNKLTGGLMPQEECDTLYNALKSKIYNKYNGNTKKYQIYNNVIVPTIRFIVSSDSYMVE